MYTQQVMNELLLLFVVICFGVAAILAVLEVFLPSGGVLGFGAACSCVAGIVLLFMFDTTWGLVGAILSIIAMPVIVGIGIRFWQDTPLARLITLKSQQRAHVRRELDPPLDEELIDDEQTQQIMSAQVETPHAALKGKTGEALTDLRPSGVCKIEGKRYDCMADRGRIEKGCKVRVVVADPFEVRVALQDEAADTKNS